MIKRFLKNIILKEKANSEKFVSYLRKQGVQIGDNVRFFSPSNTLIDSSCPWLITIGNNVNITHGVIILCHDYSWSVLKRSSIARGRILGARSPVKIGNNVFIGMNAIITRGVTVGDNVIIGAGSIVTRNCESNSVYAGNPAKRIMSLDEFYKKRERKQLDEAKEMALFYNEKFGKMPPQEIFDEYFMLFATTDEAKKIPQFYSQLKTCANFDESIAYMNAQKPMFESYENFLDYCFNESVE